MSERLRAQLGLLLALCVLASTMTVLFRGSVGSAAQLGSGPQVPETRVHTRPTHLASTGR